MKYSFRTSILYLSKVLDKILFYIYYYILAIYKIENYNTNHHNNNNNMENKSNST